MEAVLEHDVLRGTRIYGDFSGKTFSLLRHAVQSQDFRFMPARGSWPACWMRRDSAGKTLDADYARVLFNLFARHDVQLAMRVNNTVGVVTHPGVAQGPQESARGRHPSASSSRRSSLVPVS